MRSYCVYSYLHQTSYLVAPRPDGSHSKLPSGSRGRLYIKTTLARSLGRLGKRLNSLMLHQYQSFSARVK